ncbi:MAG: hypothetical protein HRF46_10445 [Acidobacteriota bacterium]
MPKTRGTWIVAGTMVLASGLASMALAEEPASISISEAESRAVLEYWTTERMANARPLPLPGVVDGGLAMPAAPLPADARPGYSLGWDPKSGLEPPDPLTRYELDPEQLSSFPGYLEGQARGNAPGAFGSPPADPVDYPGYGKFARWTWYGNYLTYPTSTIGKLFFTIPGQGNFVCSAAVIGRSTIATAGHCVSSVIGSTPTWHTNVQFCPSYYKGGGSGAPHPNRGCWSWNYMATSTQWYNHENFDRDYACVVLATSGTVHANKVGNVTGWIGRAWNWGNIDAILAWGYPAAAPFPGYHIITVAGNEWYSVNMSNAGETSPNLSSKYIGSDMTGGSSGGPWWLGTTHPNPANNYSDTDGVIYTGLIGGPWLNGVNSHKRCKTACGTPPSSSSGTYWQEMGSPPFTSSGSDSQDSEDIFASCLNHSNNNP